MDKKDYLMHRESAIAWMNGRRDFNQGIAVLEKAGFKPGVVARLKIAGSSGPSATARLRHLMLTLIQAWALHPQETEDTDLEQGILDGKDVGTAEPGGELTIKEAGDRLEAGELTGMPQPVKDIVFSFRKAYVERDKLHRMLAGIGEDNSPEVVEKRKGMSDKIEELSAEMDCLYPQFDAYVKGKRIPDTEEPEEAGTGTEGRGMDFEKMTVENLKFMKKSVSTKILRATNRLLYQSETKQEKPNPMPDGPERVKYETKIKVLSDRLEQIKMELARRVEC